MDTNPRVAASTRPWGSPPRCAPVHRSCWISCSWSLTPPTAPVHVPRLGAGAPGSSRAVAPYTDPFAKLAGRLW